MSTRITVQVVDDLIGRAQAQQQANRQAQVDRERRQRLEKKGEALQAEAQPEEPAAVPDPLERLTATLLPVSGEQVGKAGALTMFRAASDGAFVISCTSGDGTVTISGTPAVWDGRDPAGYGRNIIPRPELNPGNPDPYEFSDGTYSALYYGPNGGVGPGIIALSGSAHGGWALNSSAPEGAQFVLPISPEAAIIVGILTVKFSRAYGFAETPNVGVVPETYTTVGNTTTLYEVVAFLTTAATVRQIPVPAAFRARLETILPPDTEPLAQFPGLVAPLLWQTSNVTASRRWSMRPTAQPSAYTIYNYPCSQAITTPAIYSTFASYEAINAMLWATGSADAPGTINRYAFTRGYLPLSARSLRPIGLSATTPPRVYSWRAVIPATRTEFTTAPPTAPWSPQNINRVQVTPDGEAGAYWDWGNPAYCRQQLLALDFTSDDLTP